MKATPQQLAAIRTKVKNALVLAGPGSGKTFTGAQRVLWLIEGGMDPAEICVIVFTNAAARVFQKAIGEVRLGFLGTLHSFCHRHIERFGDGEGPVFVMDEDEADAALLRAASGAGVKAAAKDLKRIRRNWLIERELSTTGDPLRLAVRSYYHEMIRNRTFDYNSLLEHALHLLSRDPLRQRQWALLVVDEYQDASWLDARIYDAIAAGSRFIIGDPDQGIFGWRGGDVREILGLSRNPHWEKHYLEENFRSAREICAAAQRLIEHGADRVQKATRTSEDRAGTVRVSGQKNATAEAVAIARWLREQSQDDGKDLEGYAVLARTNSAVDFLREHLQANGVPCKVRADAEKPEDWTSARAALDFIANRESEAAVRRWLMTRGMDKVLRNADAGLLSLTELYGANITGDADRLDPELAALGVSDESQHRILTKFRELPETADLTDLSLALALEPHSEEVGTGVTVTTVHGAKGREWDVVVFAAFEDEVIPGARKKLNVEEERRIAYVGFTRARRELIVTWAAFRAQWGRGRPWPAKPSRFLTEAGLKTEAQAA